MHSEPLISCIMPTADRPQFVPQAVEMFLAQTWPNKELVVVDNGRRPVDIPACGGVRVHRVAGRHTIGELRNLACSRAAGEIICFWDDDDLYAADRIEDQVTRLLASGKQVTGYHTMLFVDLRTGEKYRFRYQDPNNAIGVSLMFWKEFWRAHPFDPQKKSGEDTDLIMKARHSGQLISVDAENRIVATIHAGNTSPRDLRAVNWERAA